jgi:hypothetical protein
MLSNLSRRDFQEPPDPLDVLIGRCPTCKSVVECARRDATPPDSKLRGGLRTHTSAEVGGFGAWFELWSVECPVCVAKTAKVTGVEGDVTQGVEGARVYLTKKAGGK